MESQDEYKYLDQFYKDAFIKKENIVLQNIRVSENGICYIQIAEKTDFGVTVTTAMGKADKIIRPEDIDRIPLNRYLVEDLYKIVTNK
ncbi:MAG: hypothetical protein Q8936_01320 [Bacillota bacterium]|nr:hypothetical protein [Bacillota bacterium]